MGFVYRMRALNDIDIIGEMGEFAINACDNLANVMQMTTGCVMPAMTQFALGHN